MYPYSKYAVYLLLCLHVLSTSVGFSQVNNGFNYQAVARNAQGNLLANQNIEVRFSIRTGNPTGPIVYTENHNGVTTNEWGLFNVLVGKGNPTAGNFNQIDWASSDFFITTEINRAEIGTDQFQSVPYSKVATHMRLENLLNVQENLNPQNGQVLTWNGSEWIARDINTRSPLTAGSGISISDGVITNTQPDREISLSGGNNINVTGSYPNFTISSTDRDNDPQNEIQTLSLDDRTLSISNGNSVELPEDEGGNTVWEQNGQRIFYNSGNVGVGTNNPQQTFSVDGNIGLYFGNQLQAGLSNSNTDGGSLGILGPNGNLNVSLTSQAGSNLSGNGNLGAVSVYDANGNNRAFMTVPNLGYGLLTTRGPQGTVNIQLDATANNLDRGFISVSNENSQERSALSINTENAGFLRLLGINSENIIISSLQGFSDHGFFAVQDPANQNRAGMFVNASGQGVIFGDVKNFKIDHPLQPEKEIWYASIEGPEAAAYIRGTSKLRDGEAEIVFPDHFQVIANPQNMTVMLTPLSAESRGIAVVQKTATGFKVRELLQGRGNYEFDWEVKCIRKGYEDYQVIRKKREWTPATSPSAQVDH